jgi:hypothetical protein
MQKNSIPKMRIILGVVIHFKISKSTGGFLDLYLSQFCHFVMKILRIPSQVGLNSSSHSSLFRGWFAGRSP